ncbi:MAG: ATP-binding protein [Bacteroidia bacterium]|nr:ATP-binding protein [Bacteroidia bacterium]
MITKDTFRQIVNAQRVTLLGRDAGLEREILTGLTFTPTHAQIISGIRRSGKSTLLLQLIKDRYPTGFFLNFEDPRLYNFEFDDFFRLDEIISQSESSAIFFDEIQVIPQWERYVRQKIDEGKQLFITGSNASLLSKELGTKLTGRHLTHELFPFSYREFCDFTSVTASADSLETYLHTGGFPGFVDNPDPEQLRQLFDDILIRDIAVRYSVRDIRTLRQLALFLVSNIGKPVTANKLTSSFAISSTSTMLEYLSHLEQSWLLFLLPRFSYSLRKQQVNPRKVYAIDTGLIEAVSASFSEDRGRKFENMIFLELRRQYREIYYFSEQKECDFLVFERGALRGAIQVCYHLSAENLSRELDGLWEAMNHFQLSRATLITFDQSDQFEQQGKIIDVIPAWKFLLNPLLPPHHPSPGSSS